MKIKIGDLNFPFHKFQILMYKASLLWGLLTWVSQMIANKTNSYILISLKMSVATIFSTQSSILCACILICVLLFATPRTVSARFLCPWDSPGKNTGQCQ